MLSVLLNMSSKHFSIRRHRSVEGQPFLPSNNASVKRVIKYYFPVVFCMKSKAVTLILMWTIIIGTLSFSIINCAFILLLYHVSAVLHVDISYSFVILYSCVGFLHMFYPLCGCFADVYCGRFKIIFISLSMLCCLFSLCIIFYALESLSSLSSKMMTFVYATTGIVLFAAYVCIAGYGANFIQFGLDQLLEAPSRHQALFVHWAKWCYDLLITVIVLLTLIKMSPCWTNYDFVPLVYIFIFITSITLCILLLILSCWKRHWLYTESWNSNPYKMVVKVMVFAWKHKYPLRRSAFTYCDDERPSRLDFGKERFGGPFTTEQVEDVKTFFRIVAVLFAVGLVFVIDPPSSILSTSLIGSHLVGSEYFQCTWDSIIVTNGLLRCIVSSVFLPIYMWIIFSLLRKRIPKMFCRLGLGIFLHILGVLSIFILDVVGHIQYNGNTTHSLCVFNFIFNETNKEFDIPHLYMHWSVYIPSNVLIGIGPTLVTVTIFEFISAQSPHSMKGLLLGTYYAISGVSQFISSIALVPFTLNNILSLPSKLGCLFGYLLFTCAIAIIGFFLFLVVAKWYKYRVRDDRPYDQRFVIDVYDRYLNSAQDCALSNTESTSNSLASY